MGGLKPHPSRLGHKYSFYEDTSHQKIAPYKLYGAIFVVRDDRNSLFPYLVSLFGAEKALALCQRYRVGTTRDGRVIFWQVDHQGKVRGGKIIRYDPTTVKRQGSTSWVHSQPSVSLPPGYELQQCFFGEHLLAQHPSRQVGIVESEKTALVAEGFLPDKFVWLAGGSKNGLGGHLQLNRDKCRVLQDREVVMFPDLSHPQAGEQSCYDLWLYQAHLLQETFHCTCTVSRFMEDLASESMRAKGYDLADWLPTQFTHVIPDHLWQHALAVGDTESPFYLPF